MSRREAYIKRTAVVRKQKIALVIIFSLVLLTSLTFISSKAYAGNFKSNSDSVKVFKSVTVYSGDTLESIAANYMSDEYSSVRSYINEVMSINGITDCTKLIPGNKIIIPYYMSKSIETHCPVIEISLAQ